MWLKEPEKGNSATLTFWTLSVLACFVASILHMIGKISHTSILLELQWGLAALYLGRRFNLKTKNSEVSTNSKKEE